MRRVRQMARLVGFVVTLGGCFEYAVDLRTPRRGDSAEDGGDPGQPCPSGTRVNPATGACESCSVQEPPATEVCPCAIRAGAAPFPYCEGDTVVYECLPCTGDIRSCRTFDAGRKIATNCELLLACCAELARAEGTLPCCRRDAEVNCTTTENLGEYAFSCTDRSCCSGVACPKGDSDCAVWQTCDVSQATCVPPCPPLDEYCCSECGCECRPTETPN